MSRNHMIAIGAFVGALILVSYLGWAMLIKPTQKKIVAKLAERDDVDKQLKDAKSKAAQYDKFKAQAENIRRDLNLITLRLDTNFNLREQERFTQQFLDAPGLVVTKVTVTPRQKSKDAALSKLDETQYKIEFRGGFHMLGEFLSSLISHQRMFLPIAMELKQPAEEFFLSTLDGNVVVKVLYDQGATP